MIDYQWVLTTEYLKSMLSHVEKGDFTAEEAFDHLCLTCNYTYIGHTADGESVELTEEQAIEIDRTNALKDR